MRTSLHVTTIALVLLGLASTAAAQRAPDTATIDRGDGISKVGLDVGFTMLDNVPYDGAIRIEPYGQVVLDSGLGFYGAIPITASFGDEDDPLIPGDQDQDDVAVGNLDVGVLYVLSRPTSSLVLRGGLALPTADDDLDGISTNGAGVLPRLTDLALAVPDATYLRFSISPLLHKDKLFLRADLGADLVIDDDDLIDADSLLRLNIAGGYDFGAAALSLELATVAELDDDDDDVIDDGEDFVHTLALAARFMTETLEPFIAFGVPLDESLRDTVDLFISAGIQATFR